MNWNKLCLIGALTVAMSVAGRTSGNTRPTLAELTQRATVIKPSAAELNELFPL